MSKGVEPISLASALPFIYSVVYQYLDIGYGISDKSLLRYPIKCRTPLSSVLYRRFRYQAQSNIADHGYWTKHPPMNIQCYFKLHATFLPRQIVYS
jgi:hypothetical protein